MSTQRSLLGQLREAVDLLPRDHAGCVVANAETWDRLSPVVFEGLQCHVDETAPPDVVSVFRDDDCPVCGDDPQCNFCGEPKSEHGLACNSDPYTGFQYPPSGEKDQRGRR